MQVEATTGVAVGKSFHVSVVAGATGHGTGWQTEGRGCAESAGIRPDNGWRGPEERVSGRELEGGDRAGSSASLGLKIVEAKARRENSRVR